jgi:hypothetical protein
MEERSVPDSNSSSWKQSYLEALKETDKAKLADLAYAAEEAIFFRLRELEGSADHQEERNELKEACSNLVIVRVDRLGWPPLFI